MFKMSFLVVSACSWLQEDTNESKWYIKSFNKIRRSANFEYREHKFTQKIKNQVMKIKLWNILKVQSKLYQLSSFRIKIKEDL